MRSGERVTLQEAAAALGVSEQTARRWVKSGKLKAYRPGLRYLIPASAVEELLEGKAPKAPGPARQPEVEEPAGPTDEARRGRVEGWADYVRWRAGEIEREIEKLIPDPDSSQTYDGEKVNRLSSAWNLERRAYKDYRGELQPGPGDEAMMVEGALARLGQVLKAGEARDKARGGAWDRGAADLRAKQPARPGIGGE